MEKIICLVFLLSIIVSLSVSQKEDSRVCPSPTTYSNVCRILCYDDSDCRRHEKCCETVCGGSLCVRAMQPRRSSKSDEKEGRCPKPSGPWVCSSRCSSDSDCKGTKKCCKNRCGANACVRPETHDYKDKLM